MCGRRSSSHTHLESASAEASSSCWAPLGLFEAVQLMKVLFTHWPRPLHFYPETLKLLMLCLHHWTLCFGRQVWIRSVASFTSAKCRNASSWAASTYTILIKHASIKNEQIAVFRGGSRGWFLNTTPVKTQTHEYCSAYAPLPLLLLYNQLPT